MMKTFLFESHFTMNLKKYCFHYFEDYFENMIVATDITAF